MLLSENDFEVNKAPSGVVLGSRLPFIEAADQFFSDRSSRNTQNCVLGRVKIHFLMDGSFSMVVTSRLECGQFFFKSTPSKIGFSRKW